MPFARPGEPEGTKALPTGWEKDIAETMKANRMPDADGAPISRRKT
jgi:hypothetical protein